jgi:dihydroorotate dehydrogenase (fumarate)
MVLINTIEILPPLLNSSCAWSSDLAQLTELYESPYTGAITTRSATDQGFLEDDTHTVCCSTLVSFKLLTVSQVAFSVHSLTTINSFGYSPYPLSQYLEWVGSILTSHQSSKPIIISIAASNPTNLRKMLRDIQVLRQKLQDHQVTRGRCRIAVEFNLSCPNIANSAPLGYIHENIIPFVVEMRDAFKEDPTLTVGCKMPPYLYQAQFTDFLQILSSVVTQVNDEKRSPISFLTCTNTLGNSLLFSSQTTSAALPSSDDIQFALPTPLGGLAGDSIHALSLGNIFTFKHLIASQTYVDKGLGDLKIIGVGGVTSKAAAERMREAGADAVACATLFGKEGVQAFEILQIL